MSIHLSGTPVLFYPDEIKDFKDLNEDKGSVDFKIDTLMSDMDLMEEILDNSLLGFKNKRALYRFTEQGDMIFYYNPDIDLIQIYFNANFNVEEAVIFINNLNKEYLKRTNQLNTYKEITSQKTIKHETRKKSITKSTNLKNKSIIESIIDTSYLGFNSKDELSKFKNKGEIILNKAENGTYNIIFLGDYNQNEIDKYIENLTSEYASKVQELTYEKVLNKINKYNYKIESENIDNNDSIILTLNID